MSINLSDNNPRVEYSVAQGVTQTSFAIPFEFFDDSDVKIYVDGTLKTEGVDYTLTGGDGSTGTASISVTGAAGGSFVIITRRIALERTTDFTAGADINRAALNQQLDTLVGMAADLNDEIGRAFRISPTTLGVPNTSLQGEVVPNSFVGFGPDGNFSVLTAPDGAYISAGAATVAVDSFTGDGVTVDFTMGGIPASSGNVFVYLDGIMQDAANYTVSGTVLTFTTAPPLNSNIEMRRFQSVFTNPGATTADLVTYSPAGSGAVARTVQARLRDFVSVKDFGAVGDGVTDDTAAIQAALDSGQPAYAPPGEYLITNTLLLDPGAALIGAGGVANYAEAATQIRFAPPTKRDVFNWRTAPIGYVFAGLKLKGFTIRGFGAGASACLDVPLLYNGDLDFFAFSGIDAFARVEKWMDTNFHGGAQGFSVFGVEFKNTSGGSSDVTTTSNFDLYLSQGPTGYVFQNYGVSGINIKGVVESVDCVFDMARGNVVSADIYTENAPRTDAGAAFKVGKTGSAPASATSLMLNLNPGIGFSTGSLPANCLLLDADVTRFVKISGYAYLYGALLATTANTQRVVLSNLDTDNCPWLSLSGGIADMAAITATGFRPRNMQTRGDSFFSEYNLAGPNLELFPLDRAAITRRKMAVDAWTSKLVRRDASNNLSQPIGYLETTATSGWTFNGAKLVPGELVIHGTSDTGQVALWRSQRHSQDTPVSAVGNTNAGTAVIGSGAPGTFSAFAVNDWVTVSGGYGSATFQRRIVSKATDDSQITLDTVAASTVIGVTVATEAHQLVPVGQQGYRQAATAPGGIVTPKYLGEEYFDTAASNWYKSTGLTSADWKLIS